MRSTRRALMGMAGGLLATAGTSGAQAQHRHLANVTSTTFRCGTSGPLPAGTLPALDGTPLWKNVISHLIVNRDRRNPCFAFSDKESWTRVLSRMPADVVGIQAPADASEAIIYMSGVPDYQVEMPSLFSSFRPGMTYGIYRIRAVPEADERPVHELSNKGAVGFFVNGVAIFNYTDTFAWGNTGLWCYDANVAEASIVNSDVSHATPSNLPQFPHSRGIFHNHQVSAILLHQLMDPFVLGRLAQSKLLGFMIDNHPIYGPIGYSSKDRSSGLKMLRSSYLPRSWLTGTGNRSSTPGWAVVNWDGGQVARAKLLNLFQKDKSEVLFTDGRREGPIAYQGSDARLAAEIAALQASVGLQRDAAGFVYWEAPVPRPGGGEGRAKNYLLKSSELWGPAFDAEILPASYQVADTEKFAFKALLGSFAEDYDYIEGYGDLDFYNGIDSFLEDRGTNAYHYVTPFSGEIGDANRFDTAAFPYSAGIQFKGKVDPFNDTIDNTARLAYFASRGDTLQTVFDLGVIGRDEAGQAIAGSVFPEWRRKLTED